MGLHFTLPGVDDQGFILAVADARLQPAFAPLLADVCSTLAAQAPGLDGIYAYGSVARGEARAGVSDLDLTVLLREPPSPAAQKRLESLRRALEARHQEVVKIDFDIGSCAEALDPGQTYRWGFWLRHHCRCLWGADRSRDFGPFRPSRDIALAMNGDFETVLGGYLANLGRNGTLQDQWVLQRAASRKLLRATQILQNVYRGEWPWSLDDHAQLFLRRHPDMAAEAAFFLAEAHQPAAGCEEFSARLHALVTWMAQQHRAILQETSPPSEAAG